MTTATNQTRLLALCLFVFLGTFAAIVWYVMRPYGSVYFSRCISWSVRHCRF